MSGPTLLVTSVGSISAVGLIWCLDPVRSQLRIVGTNSIAEAAGNFLTDRTVLVPPTVDAEGWLAAVGRVLDEEAPDLVLNGRDEEVGLLARLCAERGQARPTYLVPPLGAERLFGDKHQMALFAREHGLPFAESASTAGEIDDLVARRGFPVVVKPRFGGTGTRGVFLARAAEELDAVKAAPTYVVQEMLASRDLDEGISAWKTRVGVPWVWALRSVDHEVDLLIDGKVVALVMSVGTAEGAMNRDIRLVDEPALRSAGEAWGEALAAIGHRGPVNIQGRLLPDGRYVPFELNARFTGTMIGKAQLGRNLVVEALHHWCGIGTAREPAPGAAEVMQRLPSFLPVGAAAVRAMADSGEWRR